MSSPHGFPDWKPGRSGDRRDLARMDRQAQAGNRAYFEGEGVDEFTTGEGGTLARANALPGLWARLTDTDGEGNYSWVAIYREDGVSINFGEDGGGNRYGLHNGHDPAREINGNTLVSADPSTGTVVWLTRDEDGLGWSFTHCCDGSGGNTIATDPEWTTDQDDWEPPVAETVRVSTDGPHSLTGVVPQDPDVPARLTIINVGDEVYYVTHEDSSSTPGNRIRTPSGEPLEIPPGNIVELLYDPVLERQVVYRTTATITFPPQTVSTGVDLDDLVIEPGTQIVEITPSDDVLLRGIMAPDPEWARTLTIRNKGPGWLTIPDDSSSSTTANRIKTPSGEPLPIPPGGTAQPTYDPLQDRWVITTTTGPIPYPVQEETPSSDIVDLVIDPGTEYVYLTSTGPISLTSIQAPPTPWPQRLTFVNTSPDYPVLVPHLSTDTSVPANRINLPFAVDMMIPPGDRFQVIYDPVNEEWLYTYSTAPTPDRVDGLTISTNQDDLPIPPGVGQYLLNVTSPSTLSGLDGLTVGQEVVLTNKGTETLSLLHQDSGSESENQFYFASEDDFDLEPEASITIRNDGSVLRDDLGITAIAAAAAAGGGGGTTGTNGSAALGGSYSVTGSFASTGLSVTLPSAGTYLILCNAVSAIDGSQHEYSSFRLYDSTNSVAVGPIGRHELGATTAAQPHTAVVTLHHIITVTGSTTVRLEANTTTTGTADVLLTSTVLRYVKLA